jgi:hypothetical protein
MTSRFATVKKFAGLAMMATAVAAVGLGLGAGTAQATPRHPEPRPPQPFHQDFQRIDNFFDRHVTGEGTRVDNFFDRLNGVK